MRILSLVLEDAAFNRLLKRVGCIDPPLSVTATGNEMHGSVSFLKLWLPTEAPFSLVSCCLFGLQQLVDFQRAEDDECFSLRESQL